MHGEKQDTTIEREIMFAQAKGGSSSFANALSLVTAWETWYLPSSQPVDPVLITSPDAWELDARYPDNFGQPTFPSNRSIPIA